MPDAAANPDNEVVPAHDCPTVRLESLRQWAWARGRTDVILLLDVHDWGWSFHRFRRHHDLERFAELIVGVWQERDLTDQTSRLARSGGTPAETAALAERLEPQLLLMCDQLLHHAEAAEIGVTTAK